MPLRVCCFEDDTFANFYPLTHLRPAYMLRPGAAPLFKRIEQQFPGCSVSLVARDHLAPLLAEQQPDYPIGIVKRDNDTDVLFLNGRIRSYGDLAKQVREARLSTVFKNGDTVIAVLFRMDTLKPIPLIATHLEYLKEFQFRRSDIPEFPTTATLYSYLWEMIEDIEMAITADVTSMKGKQPKASSAIVHPGAYVVNASQVFLDADVQVYPGAVIDASKGPVYVGEGTRVESHASIYGPTYVGPGSIILAGKVSQCSIGPGCRIGGEVEESFFHSYVNKYHAGFIGHSAVGSWVNFGAMTTNSDLKNNYSTIRVSLNGRSLDTGSIKVGSFIGDHTKFGIGTLLNTGISIGVCCNIFGGGLTSDKEIASFQWGNTGHFETYDFDKAIDTARRTAGRRKIALSDHEASLLKDISVGTPHSEGTVVF